MQQLPKKTGLSKKDSEKAVNATFDTITANLEVGEKVQLVGFGVFDIKERGSRIGRNPKTKEEIEIPATRVPVFKGRQSAQGRCFQIRTHKRSGSDPERFSQEDAYAPGQISESFAAHQAPHRSK